MISSLGLFGALFLIMPEIIWAPQEGPQTEAIRCPVFEVFYGGARGGGKTDASIGDWLEHMGTYGGDANGIFVRRTSKQLEEVVARTKQIYPHIGGHFREQKGEWEFQNGARQKFRYLERDRDAEEYQGHNYTWLGVEEVTNFPSPEPINKMRATLRSAKGVATRMFLTGNPGGPGHQWVKDRYVAPCKTGYKVLREKFHNPFNGATVELERVFIPSKLKDNPILLNNDPTYVARLQQQGSAQLVQAWLDGNWDIVMGAFFDCFDSYKHVLDLSWGLRIPKSAPKFRSFDWGSAKPFSVGWYALSDGTWDLPKGALVKYREWYGMKPNQPNVGLKMDADLVAQGIREREKGDIIQFGVADPAIFIRDGGPSIAEMMLARQIVWKPADRKRKTGWNQLRKYLVGDADVPLIYFLECCEDTIRTLPAVPHDENDSEDVDTDSEDHAADETRYMVMSRPHARPGMPLGSEEALPPNSMGRLVKEHLRKMKEKREEMRI